MSRSIPAEFYVELTPKMGQRYNSNTRSYEDRVETAKAVRTTKAKPDNIGRNNVVVKMQVYVPEHLFLSGIPEATVVLTDNPEESVTVHAQWQDE